MGKRKAVTARLLITLLALGCGGGPTPASPGPASGNPAATFAEFASEAVRKAAQTYPETAFELETPLSLTTSDGTGLELTKVHGRAVIDGPLAFTELRLQFRNPENRVREGRFSITLPDGAAISRLSMRIEGHWQEAEVVERQLARRAYEDFLHRRQDPALLEKEAGNQFRARIFPIPANDVKDIIVSYSHVLDRGAGSYTLPLRGLPEVADLDLHASIRSASGKMRDVAFARKRHKPTADFVAKLDADRIGLRSGKFAAVRIAPKLSTKTESISELTVLFDTSASRAPGFARSIENLGKLVDGLREQAGNFRLRVVAFDQEVQEVYSGNASDFGSKELSLLRARRPLGASDLGAAMSWLGTKTPKDRLVVVSDGIATAGGTESGTILAAAKKLAAIDRLDIVLSGGIRDRELAAALVTGQFQRDGAVIDDSTTAGEAARRIGLATRSRIELAIDDSRWTWPQQLDGVQAGDEFVVFAEMKGAAPEALTVNMTGGHTEAVTIKTVTAIEPLLRRSIAAAEIARLSHRRQQMTGDESAKKRESLKQRIIATSTRYRVLSDFTALLVLETDADYTRFGIDRNALSQIMTIGQRGIEFADREAPVLHVAKPPRKQPETQKLKKKSVAGDGDGDADTGFGEPGSTEVADSKPMDKASMEPMPEPKADQAKEEESHRVSERDVTASRIDRRRPAPPPTDNDADGIADEDDADDEAEAEGGQGGGDAFAEALKNSPPALTGRMATIIGLVDSGKSDSAIASALAWRNDEPGDVMALVALGSSLEAAGNHRIAARAYGSIIDLFPSRADLRRFAGARLQRLRGGAKLAVDTFEKAVEQRPDHLTGYRLKAYALVRAERYKEAFETVLAGLERQFPGGRFRGGKRILGDDLGIIGAVWAKAEPSARGAIEKTLASKQLEIATKPTLRFVLNWETDANDVDFHIYDAKGGHASYSNTTLPSGGELYADVTDGYGPECFAIEKASAFPYRLQIHYYSRGPMGYGMGQVEIMNHDGSGNLSFEERPFVVMNDGAYLDLGEVTSSSALVAR